jgi:5-amino-6-(5-phosphoribosylamino)uracil reductase
MKIIAKAAVSIDGFLDDCSSKRLILSSPEDLAEVHKLRATCDAIFVGAGTIRSDNPSLVTRVPELIAQRKTQGKPPDPVKVTITASGNLSPEYAFFGHGDGEKVVYCTASAAARLRHELHGKATILTLPEFPLTAGAIATDLERRGVETLLVEGGSAILTMFLREGMVDLLRMAVAPLFVGEEKAPRFMKAVPLPDSLRKRVIVEKVELLGDTVVILYSL